MNLDAIDRLPFAERQRLAVAAVRAADARYNRDPWRWLQEQVVTRDEAEQREARWPDMQYARELLAALESEPMLAIPKSRRMMVSWLVAAWVTWRARYYPNNEIYWQSLSEEIAAEQVNNRMVFIEEHLLAPALRRGYDAIRTNKGLVGKMTYQLTQSAITAIAQGGDKIRSRTPSILVMDESEFQPEASKALTAALAVAEKKAKLVLVSSSNGPSGILANLCRGINWTRFA